jgi:hemerythrin-like domain-containing protein
MRQEHQAIHALGKKFIDTLAELRDRDHPALEAEVRSFQAALDQAQREPASAAALARVLREMTELLQSHFAKEEQVLFPLADSLLPADLQQELGMQLAAYPGQA